VSTPRRLRPLVAVTLGVIALLVADLVRHPERQLSTRVLVAAIVAYRTHVSPLVEWSGVRCRFTPTCSRYGLEVVRRFGAFRGGAMAFGRILRCGPWTAAGTLDEPPMFPAASGTPPRTVQPPRP
jgi:uncharacterized protein